MRLRLAAPDASNAPNAPPVSVTVHEVVNGFAPIAAIGTLVLAGVARAHPRTRQLALAIITGLFTMSGVAEPRPGLRIIWLFGAVAAASLALVVRRRTHQAQHLA